MTFSTLELDKDLCYFIYFHQVNKISNKKYLKKYTLEYRNNEYYLKLNIKILNLDKLNGFSRIPNLSIEPVGHDLYKVKIDFDSYSDEFSNLILNSNLLESEKLILLNSIDNQYLKKLIPTQLKSKIKNLI